jgi:hypothetical protein
MKSFVSFSLAVICCICLMVATERRAMAYVDPGSGLLAIQSLAAAFTAGIYFMRRRIAALFGKKPAPSTPLPAVVKNDSRNAA